MANGNRPTGVLPIGPRPAPPPPPSGAVGSGLRPLPPPGQPPSTFPPVVRPLFGSGRPAGFFHDVVNDIVHAGTGFELSSFTGLKPTNLAVLNLLPKPIGFVPAEELGAFGRFVFRLSEPAFARVQRATGIPLHDWLAHARPFGPLAEHPPVFGAANLTEARISLAKVTGLLNLIESLPVSSSNRLAMTRRQFLHELGLSESDIDWLSGLQLELIRSVEFWERFQQASPEDFLAAWAQWNQASENGRAALPTGTGDP